MYLNKVILKNFRCFENLELSLHPRLTVLVAENGGGKTSVLDAIAIGLSPLLRYLSSADQRLNGPGIKDGDFRLTSESTPPSSRNLDLFQETLSKPQSEHLLTTENVQIIIEADEKLRWDNWRGASEGKQPDTKIGQSELMAFASALLQGFRTSVPKMMPVFAYYGARRGWLDIPERLRGTKENYSHPTSALIGALDSLSDFAEMLKWFDIEEATELRANKGKPSENFDKSPALAAVRLAITALLGGNYDNPHFNKKHKFVVEPQSGPGEMQVSHLSQGYQSMLALGMDFARRLALANRHLDSVGNDFDWSFATRNMQEWKAEDLKLAPPRGPSWASAIMLVDEIDLHLHPSWQQRVLPDLMRTFPGTQFIVTTHSPQVLSTVKNENIRVLKRTPGDKWQASEPSQNPYAHASSLSLEAIMESDSYPPLPIRENLREYQRLVGDGLHASPRAKELRAGLEKEWGVDDFELQLMDVVIRKNETLRKMREKAN